MSRLAQWTLLLAGIILGQVILYGPSLAGQKILLPLDVLASPNIYLPQTQEVTRIQPHNSILSDLVFLFEPERRFAVSELHAGRLPMWASYHFGGAPFIWPKFSPFMALQCCTASPVILAWSQLLAALVAGVGAYQFCRRALGLSYWPAALAGWCYPLTGFLVLSQGFTLVMSIYWLPWIFVAVNATVRRTSRFAPVALSAVTAFTLTSGQLDVAGQVLLVSGCFAAWCWLDEYRKQCFSARARQTLILLAAGWGLGFMLATPYTLPALDYARNGARTAKRSAGAEERPPVGLPALPQVVLPRMYGTSERGSLPLFPENQFNLQESSAATYAGMVATLFLAPIAFCSRRHRSVNCFLVLLAFFGLSWCLNVPGVVTVLRLPGLNMMSYNRLVFAASFAILSMAAIGMEVLWQREYPWRRWSWLPLLVLAGLCAWCAYRAIVLPEPIKSELGAGIAQGKQTKYVHDLEGVRAVQSWYARSSAVAAVLAVLGLAGWLYVWRRRISQPAFFPLLGAVMVGDLLWFSFGRYPQTDPALYYPRLPVLEQLAKAPPGRVVGYSCLPALLPSTHGLKDIRGYDPIVPRRMLELVSLGADSRSTTFAYGLMQWMTPQAEPTPEGGIRLPPVFDLLNVRYIIFRGTPQPGDRPLLQGPDYWVLENRSALPRVFVPQHVEVVLEAKTRLQALGRPDFDPRKVAFVDSALALPANCRGAAEIVDETPTRVTVSLRMATPGLVVLADLWDRGWRAFLNGQRVPILVANHALRGVVVQAGEGKLEFRYEPASFAWGLGLAGLAALSLLLWATIIWRGPPPRTVPPPQTTKTKSPGRVSPAKCQ
jgi:hypothetical protein